MHHVVDMALAALPGVSALFAMGILNGEDITGAMKTAAIPLALLFSGKVVVHPSPACLSC